MQVEIVRMIDAGAHLLALGYAAARIAAGYLALHLASITVRRVRINR
jgi:fluoride ion exporter CrcB/FEX